MNRDIYNNAEKHIGETAWAFNVEREAEGNDSVCVPSDENKCNLFVYEVILDSGFDIGTPNTANPLKNPLLAVTFKLSRPPCAIDWYENYKTMVKGATLVGEGNDCLENALPGDIITDGVHMGIYAGNEEAISANPVNIAKKGIRVNWLDDEGYGYENRNDGISRIFRIFRISKPIDSEDE